MRVVGLFIGKPREADLTGGRFYTGGAKSAVASAYLRFHGFEGDGQGNLKYHGGKDRTACVYPAERYAWWKEIRGYDLPFGAFSENLAVEGATEEAVCIGDVYRIGDALVQVTLPRDPCRTIDRVTGVPGLWGIARDTGACGFHMRTVKEGLVTAGSPFVLESRHPEGITVAMALALYHGRSRDVVLADRLVHMPEFAVEGKKVIAARLGL